MHMRCMWAGLTLLCGAALVFAEPQRVSGVVKMKSGKPVAGAEVSAMWDWNAEGGVPREPLKTDAAGAFAGELDLGNGPAVLLAYDADRKYGGVLVLDPRDADEPLGITIAAVSKVRGMYACPNVELSHVTTFVSCATPHGKIRCATHTSDIPEFEIPLPVGEFELSVHTNETREFRRPVTTKLDKRVIPLGKIMLEPTALAQHAGKPPPPIYVSEARGVPAQVKLSDFKGKWVLLEFWGFW